MQKRVNEKVLEFRNETEKRETKKDIFRGPVKIGAGYYEFEERVFFDEKLKMYIPKGFEDMPLDARRIKNPSENRLEIIKSNDSWSIAITFKFIDNPLNGEYIEQLRDMMKLINKRLNPANIFYDEDILDIDKKDICYFDFKSSKLGDFLYNLVFLLEFEGKALIGTFICSYSEHKEWKDVFFEMLKTTKIVKEKEVI